MMHEPILFILFITAAVAAVYILKTILSSLSPPIRKFIDKPEKVPEDERGLGENPLTAAIYRPGQYYAQCVVKRDAPCTAKRSILHPSKRGADIFVHTSAEGGMERPVLTKRKPISVGADTGDNRSQKPQSNHLHFTTGFKTPQAKRRKS